MVERRKDWVARPEAPEAPAVHKKLKFRVLADVEPEEVKWLWYPYIPAGKLTLLEGDPGMGKSWITCMLAADLSKGRPLPGVREPLPPQRILMLSAEDGLGDTVRPRVEAMDGDLTRIMVSDDHFILDPAGIRDMWDLMRQTAATVVFMDPIVAYLGGKVDMHRSNEVRPIMAALAAAAAETGTAIVGVRHLRKGGADGKSGKAIYSGIGSIDFTAAVRSVIQVQETKSGTKYLYHAKHNLTPKGKSIAYTMVDGKFVWEGDIDEEPTDIVVSKRPRQTALAQTFLFDLLKNGPVSAIVVSEMAAAAGHAMQTINRAKTGFALSRKTPQGWVWELDPRVALDSTAVLR